MRNAPYYIWFIFILNTMWYAPFLGLRWIIYPLIYPEWLQSIEGNATAFMFFIFACIVWLYIALKEENYVMRATIGFFSLLCFINQFIYCIEDIASLFMHTTFGDVFLTILGISFLTLYAYITINFLLNWQEEIKGIKS